MVPEGWPTQAVVMMKMMMMVEVRRIQRRLLATNQGRGNNIDYLQSRHIDIQHIFLLLLLLFLFPLAKI